MPMTVKVGLAKKVGQPDFGSLGASCDIELELDGGLLFHDLDGLQQKVRAAYTACRQAVNDELAGQSGSASPALNSSGAERTQSNTNGHERGADEGSPRGNPNRDSDRGAHGSQNGRSTNGNRRAATSAQVRALHSIATRQNFNLTELLREKFHIYGSSKFLGGLSYSHICECYPTNENLVWRSVRSRCLRCS